MTKPQTPPRPAASMLVGPNIAGEAIRDEAVHDFDAQWCRDLLNDPSYHPTAIYTRKTGVASDSSFNSLLGKTLFTDETIRAIVFLYRPAQPAAHSNVSNRYGGELLALVSLGSGMCSHEATLHGGINTVLVDEIGGGLASHLTTDPFMAVNFNVNLRSPVRTPGIILGRAWMDRGPQGRKHWVQVRLEQDGRTCVESENLYLKIESLSKL